MGGDQDISRMNKSMALRHSELVTGAKSVPVHIRFKHDTKEEGKYPFERKGTIEELWHTIEDAQRNGYGVFLVVNEGDPDRPHELPDGRIKRPMVKDDNISRIRSFFTDRDGPLEPNGPTRFHVRPSFVNVRNKTNKHAYWLVSGCPVSEFRNIQRRLSHYYGTDPSISNPSRIMRLSGTLRLKDPNNPTPYQLQETGNKLYKLSDILEDLPELPVRKRPSSLNSDDPRVLHPETVEKMFAHWDPTLKGSRGLWIGAIKLLAEHGIALTCKVSDDWWLSVA